MSLSWQDIVRELKICYEDHQLGAAYSSQIKARTLLSIKLLQQLEEVVEYLAYRALVYQPQDLI